MIPKRAYFVAIVALAGVAAFLTSSLAQPAAAPAPLRIAFCDLVSVFNSYERATDLTTQLKDKQLATKAESEQRQKKLEALRRELENYKRGSQQYERTANELMRQSIELQAFLQYNEQLALREHRALTKEMYEEILGVVRRIAVQQGVSVVMQREQELVETEDTNAMLQQIYNRKVLYFADSLDVTETVLSTLNNEYRSGKTAPPAAPKIGG